MGTLGLILLAIGLVAIVEGLALALAPSRIVEALIWLTSLPVQQRRLLGLAAMVAGTALIWVAQTVAG